MVLRCGWLVPSTPLSAYPSLRIPQFTPLSPHLCSHRSIHTVPFTTGCARVPPSTTLPCMPLHAYHSIHIPPISSTIHTPPCTALHQISGCACVPPVTAFSPHLSIHTASATPSRCTVHPSPFFQVARACHPSPPFPRPRLQQSAQASWVRLHSDWVSDLAYVPTLQSGTLVSSSFDGTLKILDPELGRVKSTLLGHRRAVHCFTPLVGPQAFRYKYSSIDQ